MTCDYIKLQQSGQAYPRTCPECGLGPCKYRTMTAAIKDAGDDVVEPILWAPEKNGNMMPVARDERLVEYVWHEDYKKLQSAYKRACVERGELKVKILKCENDRLCALCGEAIDQARNK